MVVRVGGQAFALPTSAINSVRRDEGDVGPVVADLGAILGDTDRAGVTCPPLLRVGSDEAPLALRVDRVDGALELVIRPPGPLLAGHPAISGVGLSTGGELIPALDVAGLLRIARGATQCPGPRGVRERPRVLVADDSLSVRRVATRNLRALGFEVDEVADGEQALGKLRLQPYRLVLTDLEMPRMDGFALLAELGRTEAAERIPVVVTSTRSDLETRRRVLGLGARAFLAKPVDAGELAAVVGDLLGAK
jgi:CheY-like chemotaxis protein